LLEHSFISMIDIKQELIPFFSICIGYSDFSASYYPFFSLENWMSIHITSNKGCNAFYAFPTNRNDKPNI